MPSASPDAGLLRREVVGIPPAPSIGEFFAPPAANVEEVPLEPASAVAGRCWQPAETYEANGRSLLDLDFIALLVSRWFSKKMYVNELELLSKSKTETLALEIDPCQENFCLIR